MKYCPGCGAEYLPDRERCWDCQEALVDDEPPELADPATLKPTFQERVAVFRTGRRIDAELVRSRLEADGLDARIWSGGLGPWRLEAALTEVTGVPSAFNAHQVVVHPDDEDRAREVLAEAVPDRVDDDAVAFDEGDAALLSFLRKRWMLLAFAVFMLLLVIVYGPIGS